MAKIRNISSIIAVAIVLCVPAISQAHGGFAKVVDDFVVFVNQDPVSPLVGENVTTYIQVMSRDIKPIPDLPVTITLIDTAFDDERNDKLILTKNYRTNVNGSINFDYVYDKENYFDVEVAFKDPHTGRDEQTGYLVQPRDSTPGYIGQQPAGQQRRFLIFEDWSANMHIYFNLFLTTLVTCLGVLFFGR